MTQYCCKWNGHVPDLLTGMENFKVSENYVDVTLVCEGQTVKVHKIVLASFSKLLHEMFLSNPCTHPIILLQDMKFPILQAIVNFMYRGEIAVQQDDLELLLKAAKALGIKGLSDICKEILFGSLADDMVQESQNDASVKDLSSESEPARKRARTQSSDINASATEANLNTECASDYPAEHEEANTPVAGTSTFSLTTNSSSAPANNQLQSTTHLIPTSKKNAATSYETNPSPGKSFKFKTPPQPKKYDATYETDNDDGASGKKKRSFIWKFFTPLSDSIAECNSCSVTKSYKSSISNLKKHLKAKHPSFELYFGPFPDNDQESTEISEAGNLTIDDLKECGSRRKTSPLWKYFTRKNRMIAQCNLCLLDQSYRSSISNLKKHLERKHPSIDLLQSSDESLEVAVVPSTVKVVPKSSSPASHKKQLCSRMKGQKTSYLWNFFTPLDDSMAECNICLKSNCYRSSISNLKKHLIQKHPSLDLKSAQDLQDLAERNRYQDQFMAIESETAIMNDGETGEGEESQAEIGDDADLSSSGVVPGKKFEKRKKSFLWNFFDPINEDIAVCKICSANKSYRSSTSNLKKHLERSHPTTLMRRPVQLLNFPQIQQTTTIVEMEETETEEQAEREEEAEGEEEAEREEEAVADENLEEIIVETQLMPAEGSSTTPFVLKLM